jgi:hypothetical protein
MLTATTISKAQKLADQVDSSFSSEDVFKLVSLAIQGEADKLGLIGHIVSLLTPRFTDGRNWRIEAVKAVGYANGGVKPGMGATVSGYSDRAAYTIVAVSDSGKTLTLQRDKATLSPDFKPDFIPGGFAGHVANQGDQTYSYAADTNGELIKVRLRKNGRFYTKGGAPVTIGIRSEFYDYNF